MVRRVLFMVLLTATPAVGQGTTAPVPPSNVEFARLKWAEVQGYLAQAAATAPDSLFAFKPTAEVRSFGQTLDHVAASERGYCRLALGEPAGGSGAGTGATTMREVIAALQAAKTLCSRAYAQTEDEAARPAYGGGRASRLQLLLENAMHDNEHYGNIVTYLRLNHLVPPSSQPAAR